MATMKCSALTLDWNHYPADAKEGWEMLCRAKARYDQLERELAAMRLLAAEPHYIHKVKQELGPLSLWDQNGLDAHIAAKVSEAVSASGTWEEHRAFIASYCRQMADSHPHAAHIFKHAAENIASLSEPLSATGKREG